MPSPKTIHYRIELHDPHAHQYRVTLTVPDPAPRQRLSLPVWIPGSYMVREFARHLSHLEAKQGRRALALTQIDKTTWLAECGGRGALELSYLVYAFDTSVRTAFLDARRGFFNGTSLCLRVEGREQEAHTIGFGKLPRGWQVATAMRSKGAGRYLCDSYDELVDHPFELGTFWRGKFKAHGVPHEFVVAGAWPGFDGERLLADAQRICEAQIGFWHGSRRPKPPFERYVFLLNAVDDGYGGLEHRSSTALIAKRRDLPQQGVTAQTEGYVTLLGLISHEYFHTWNVKRLKPAPFERLDYTRENYTELLWFFEGFTSYYDDLFLRRCGLIDEARYLRLLAKTVNQVLGTPGRQVQSVAQASFDAWVKYYRPDENTVNATVSYYTKGSLVALLLDLGLRREGEGTLDTVLRTLWKAGRGGPVGEEHIAAALREVGGRDWGAELADWVHGTGELPLREALAAVGVRWREEAPTLAQRLGARLSADNGGPLKLQSVLSGGAAEAAGLAPGDELVALDGWRVRRADDLVALGACDRPLPLLAARDQRLLQLTLPAARAAGAVSLAADPQADGAARSRRAAWLGGA